jgi:hypothetical protein
MWCCMYVRSSRGHLVADVGEQLDDLLQGALDGLVAQLLRATLQQRSRMHL